MADDAMTISEADRLILHGVVQALSSPVTQERLRQLKVVTDGVFGCYLPPACSAHEDCRDSPGLGRACAEMEAPHG